MTASWSELYLIEKDKEPYQQFAHHRCKHWCVEFVNRIKMIHYKNFICTGHECLLVESVLKGGIKSKLQEYFFFLSNSTNFESEKPSQYHVNNDCFQFKGVLCISLWTNPINCSYEVNLLIFCHDKTHKKHKMYNLNFSQS